jgi:hypothetical protein
MLGWFFMNVLLKTNDTIQCRCEQYHPPKVRKGHSLSWSL